MAAPFVASLILVMIHAYLGLHVLARGVIFVDLALAQIAAMGAAFALLLGVGLETRAAYIVSLGFAFFGAAFFALTRSRRRAIPQEAIIGIAYAVSSSAALLALDRAPHGAEHMKTLMIGAILWTSWQQVGTLAVLAGVAALVLWWSKNWLHMATFNPDEAKRRGLRLPFWDFLFYAVFAVIVTTAVRIAGVLLVFSFLIVPSVFGTMVASNLKTRLFAAWSFGIIVTMIGCTVSYYQDLPTGAAIVCAFGIALGVGVAVKRGIT